MFLFELYNLTFFNYPYFFFKSNFLFKIIDIFRKIFFPINLNIYGEEDFFVESDEKVNVKEVVVSQNLYDQHIVRFEQIFFLFKISCNDFEFWNNWRLNLLNFFFKKKNIEQEILQKQVDSILKKKNSFLSKCCLLFWLSTEYNFTYLKKIEYFFFLTQAFTKNLWLKKRETFLEMENYSFVNNIDFRKKFNTKNHKFHILNGSFLPFILSLIVGGLFYSVFCFFKLGVFFFFIFYFILFCLVLFFWWEQVILESIFEHNSVIKKNLTLGMVLFIISEIMFFFSFFWAFFHVSLVPSIELGCVWPPKGLENLVISPLSIPLLNTILLVSSGITVTYAHLLFLLYCDRLKTSFSILELKWVLRSVNSIMLMFNFFSPTKKTNSVLEGENLTHTKNFFDFLLSKNKNFLFVLNFQKKYEEMLMLFQYLNNASVLLKSQKFENFFFKNIKEHELLYFYYSVLLLSFFENIQNLSFVNFIKDVKIFTGKLLSFQFFFELVSFNKIKLFRGGDFFNLILSNSGRKNLQAFLSFDFVLDNKKFLNNLFSAKFKIALKFLAITIGLALIFTLFQVYEYLTSNICISDGVYGSTFYIMTGFHGFHVLVGTIFLIVCFFRMFFGIFSINYFVGLECAIWYWHFVDVVWLFLYIFVYCWGNGMISDVNLDVFDFHSNIVADYAKSLQMDFQDSASFLMESIVDLHNYIMFYLWAILVMVGWVLFSVCVFNCSSKSQRVLEYIKYFFYAFSVRESVRKKAFYIQNPQLFKIFLNNEKKEN